MSRPRDLNRPPACGEKAGTHSGIKAHGRNREPMCRACADFKADYEKARRTPAKIRIAAEMRIRRRAVELLIRRHREEFGYLLLQARRHEVGRGERAS